MKIPTLRRPAAHWSETPLAPLLTPLGAWIHESKNIGLLLLAATLLGLVCANSPWAQAYEHFVHWPIQGRLGPWSYQTSLLHFVNDGLMAVFFFVMGLEIKREFMVGELTDRAAARLPVFIAFGGAIAPALLYAAFNLSGPTARGWGIPMATDAAFAMGALALLGARIPYSVKVLLATVAVVDDLIAVTVIALFYSGGIQLAALALSAVFLAILLLGNVWGVRHPLFYTLAGLATWGAFLQSGVHSTVAGVLVAWCIPIRQRIDVDGFLEAGERDLAELRRLSARGETSLLQDEAQQATIAHLEKSCESVQSPLHRIHRACHLWASLAIIPFFAFVNTGVVFSADQLDRTAWQAGLGITLGLCLGKPLGFVTSAWVAQRCGWARLPESVTPLRLLGLGCIAGIGFTVSLFMAPLSFSQPQLVDASKLFILAASALSGVVGMTLLSYSYPAESAAPET